MCKLNTANILYFPNHSVSLHTFWEWKCWNRNERIRMEITRSTNANIRRTPNTCFSVPRPPPFGMIMRLMGWAVCMYACALCLCAPPAWYRLGTWRAVITLGPLASGATRRGRFPLRLRSPTISVRNNYKPYNARASDVRAPSWGRECLIMPPAVARIHPISPNRRDISFRTRYGRPMMMMMWTVDAGLESYPWIVMSTLYIQRSARRIWINDISCLKFENFRS